jgi:quinoprotein glucose dehydrogenase
MALTWIEDVDAIVKAGKDPSAAVRMASLVALRKLSRPEVASFLKDSDPKLVLEASRAIYDTPIAEAMPALAELLSDKAPERALLRAVNAAYRLGKADALAAFASNAAAPVGARLEALQILGEWDHPSGRDRLMGLWRPVPAREREEAAKAVTVRIRELLKSGGPVGAEAARLAGVFQIEDLGDFLKATVQNRQAAGAERAAALRALVELKVGVKTLLPDAVQDPDETLAAEAVRVLSITGAVNQIPWLRSIAEGTKPPKVRQAALAGLVFQNAAREIEEMLDRGVDPALQLDLIEAASKFPPLKEKATKYHASLVPFGETLQGGDAAAGQRIFFERSDVQCVRCHTIGNEGGQVGPPLTKIAEQKTREYLLESILTPNKQIAEGWGQTAFQLQNDAVEVGRVEKESDSEVMLILPDGQRKTLAKTAIKARKAALSSMPEDIAKQLSKRDLRDLIEFLSTLK